MIGLVYLDAINVNVYCIVIQTLLFLPRANNHKLRFGNTEGNLLALSQRSIRFSSLLIWVSRSARLDAEKVTLVSSAYILGAPMFKQFGRPST